MSARLSLALLLPALGACSLAPPVPAPRIEPPATWQPVPAAVADSASAPAADWWSGYGDPVLADLVAAALAGSRDLEVVRQRLAEARAAAAGARGARFPQVDAGGEGGVREDAVQAARLGQPSMAGEYWQAGFDARWELDLFGGVRAGAQAAAAEAGAAAFVLEDAHLVLAADVGRAYFELRGAQARREVALRNIELQSQALELLRSRTRAGLSASVDVAKARVELERLQAVVPALDAAIAGAGFRLAVLNGLAPGALSARLASPRSLPADGPPIPIGLPSDLVARRPDVRAAQARVVAAAERVGAARADLLPSFQISGLLARAQDGPGDVSFGPGMLFSLGPSVRLPVFNAGRLRANVAVRDAQLAQALARHEQALLTALEDVETALAGLARERERGAHLATAVDQATLAVTLARDLYSRGLADWFAVLDAERALYSADDALVTSRAAAAIAQVALYKALGGGWTPDGADPALAAGGDYLSPKEIAR